MENQYRDVTERVQDDYEPLEASPSEVRDVE